MVVADTVQPEAILEGNPSSPWAEGSEGLGLLASEAAAAPVPASARFSRRIVAGVTFALSLVAAAFLRTVLSECEKPDFEVGEKSLVSFAESYSNQDLGTGGSIGAPEHGALTEWLSVANRVGEEEAATSWQQGVDSAVKITHAEVDKVLDDKDGADPKKATELMQQILNNAVKRTVAKRKDLKEYLEAHGLRKDGGTDTKKFLAALTTKLQASTNVTNLGNLSEFEHDPLLIKAAGLTRLQQNLSKQGANVTEDPELSTMLREIEDQTAQSDGVADQKNLIGAEGGERGFVHPTKTPGQQASMAACVFNSLGATNAVASAAANFNDALATCKDVHMEDWWDNDHTHGKVCSVNVAAVLGSFTGLSSSLSLAADNCASTMIPNIEALCSGSISGMITAVSQFAGALSLVSAACMPEGWYHRVPEGVVPSNVGSNEHYDKDPYRYDHSRDGTSIFRRYLEETTPDGKSGNAARSPDAALESAVKAPSSAASILKGQLPQSEAPSRRLLFGGGKGSTATHCALEVTGVMWNLASASLAINAAANPDNGASCPPKNLFGSTDPWFKGKYYKIMQGFCTTDAAGAIVGFGTAIAQIMLTVVNCVDELNLRAICGAGFDGAATALAGIAQAGSGIWLSCDLFNHPLLKQLLKIATTFDNASGGGITNLIAGMSESLGRRLNDDEKAKMREKMVFDHENDPFQMKKRWGSPHKVFQHLGYNLKNASAWWRDAAATLQKSPNDVLKLMEEPPQEKRTSMLGANPMCK